MPGHMTNMETKSTERKILSLISQPGTREKGIELLIDTYQEPLYWHIRKMVISHDDTKDILQNVFIRLWKNIGSFRGNSSLASWAYKIAVNEIYRFLDQKKSMMVKKENLASLLINELERSPWISGDEIQIKLQKAILQLPDKQRTVFNLRYFEEMNYEDMSEILNTSVNALKTSFHYAKNKIEKILENET